MAHLTLARPPVTGTTIKCRPAAVHVDGLRRRDLAVVQVREDEAPDFGSATLGLRSTGAIARRQSTSNISALPAIGSAVTIRLAGGTAGELFRGQVAAHDVSFCDNDQKLVARVQHYLAGILGHPVDGRWQLKDNDPIAVQHAEVSFNSAPGALASEDVLSVGRGWARVFASTASAVRWSVADALGYLMATGVPAEVEIPTQGELDSLAGDIDLGTINVTEMTAAEAMVKVAERGGLKLRAACGGSGLIVYRGGRDGRSRSLSLQPVGASLDLTRSNLWKANITFARRPSRRSVLALGELKRYESTFALSKGWEASLETSRWRDFVRSMSANWQTVADVYRKWVLNEHGRYCAGPWNLPVHNFSNISNDDFMVTAPRKFLSCLSADVAGQSLGMVVEFRCGDQDEWRRWTAPVWVCGEECGIWLGGDALPAEFFEAAVAEEAEVRITATVVADARLAVQIGGDNNCPRQVIDLSGRAAWRKVHVSSVFHGQANLGEPAERDDTDLLLSTAQRCSQVRSKATDARLALGWIDTSYHVGDIVGRVHGRELELSSNPDSRSHVISVQHDYGDTQSTILELGG